MIDNENNDTNKLKNTVMITSYSSNAASKINKLYTGKGITF